ncbi:PREDICTED: rho GDP-dissociation inhibitor 1-like [Nicotiana attenuata]|uniref:Rho gdp-dissociation inhibitor 1 n=1 Tax=Nicotiana attenuata TaxID=49451 RepID=A0A1J6I773_NICAT|nr:PREDICTED: rho GDP-dissociation inhibitor 1-like [Nicotiana attenuata]OIS96391.1 rho gdp-dissociation inhibitor 1 [Nicotiana attenuata]
MSTVVEPISPNKALAINDSNLKMVRRNDAFDEQEEEEANECKKSPLNEEDGGANSVNFENEQLEKENKVDQSSREEQLLGTVDGSAVEENQDPEVQEPRLYIICPGRSDMELSEPFISSPKDCLFTLKEGSRYKLKFSFTVSNNVVSGLKYINTTWKSGVRVDKSQVMLGNFSPRKEPYVYELEEDVTPSGVFARGLYSARTQVIDDKERCYVDIKYYFEIQKQWRESS